MTLLAAMQATAKSSETSVTSPDKKIKVTLHAADDKSYLSVSYKGKTLTDRIELGLTTDSHDLHNRMTLTDEGKTRRYVSDYTTKHGKRSHCRNEAWGRTVTLTAADGKRLGVDIRAYNDGVCFRYRIDNEERQTLTFKEENTSYNMSESANRWISKFTTCYEEDFPLQKGAERQGTWNYPMLFENANAFMLITEANANREYCATHISNEDDKDCYRVSFPFAWEGNGKGDVNPRSQASTWLSPWRVMVVGQLKDIVESTLVEDVSDASSMKKTDWIQGGRAAWIYWAYNHGTKDYRLCQQYVDLAAEMNWEYVLFDWEWDAMTNGGTIADAARYALNKGVKPLIWYNSGGPHNNIGSTPRDRFLTHENRVKELAWLKELGFVGVKIDFFESDKQDMMKYYLDILDDCAKAEMMVNFHGCTLPRGWSRTYPHLMSMEAVYGAEQYNNTPNMTTVAARINCTLPFTRNVAGPMDYTPVAFTNSQHPHTTSFAHELALSVAFESGIQHFADRPEGFKALPMDARQFMSDVPNTWDETVFINGYPGTYFVVARRKGNDWYVAGLNGTNAKKVISIPLSFLGKGERQALILSDGKDAKDIKTERSTVKGGSDITVTCLPQGGFAMRIGK